MIIAHRWDDQLPPLIEEQWAEAGHNREFLVRNRTIGDGHGAGHHLGIGQLEVQWTADNGTDGQVDGPVGKKV